MATDRVDDKIAYNVGQHIIRVTPSVELCEHEMDAQPLRATLALLVPPSAETEEIDDEEEGCRDEEEYRCDDAVAFGRVLLERKPQEEQQACKAGRHRAKAGVT